MTGDIAEAFDKAKFVPPATPENTEGYALPPECPITPLGINGSDYFYLDALRQIRILAPKDHSRNTMMSLLGQNQSWGWAHYEGRKQAKEGKWVPTGKLRTEKLGDDLMLHCALKGVWDPLDKLRESGAWPGGDGGIVLHCGSAVLIADKWHKPGELGAHVYPSQPPTPKPDPRKQSTDAGEQLRALIETWSWKRGALDARLLLGWIASAFVGGALGWRPLVWITGDKGTGKSTLQQAVHSVLGSVVYASDPTAAGIWQKLGLKTLPVILDESESEEDNRAIQKVIKLARQAASGGVVLRGGDQHKGTEFKARSSFLLSSILVPPLLPADKSRFAVLELGSLPQGGEPPKIAPDDLSALGQRILGRLMQKWTEVPGALLAWRQYLAGLGHDSRGCDCYGTLLAMADIVLTDVPGMAPVDEAWAAFLSPDMLGATDEEDADQRRCVMHLMTTQVDLWTGGSRRTISDILHREITGKAIGEEDNRKLMGFGIGLFRKQGDEPVIAVANDHRQLATMFRDTQWASRAGAGGGWVQSLRRLNGAKPGQQRFDGLKLRCTEIPVGEIFKESTP